MDENYILKEGCITSPMLDEHSTATIVEKTVNVSDIGEFVVGEMNSSVITFKMNRYYDGVDLLQKDILIMYKNTNGVYKDKAVNIQYSTDGLKFSWIVPNDATKVIKITAYVCFISDDYLWKTKNFTISFNPSFDVTDTEHATNWFVSLESELIKINKKIDQIAEWARQPEKPTYTYEEVGAEKAGTSEKNLEKSKSYTDEEVRKVKEEVLPEKIKDVETFVSTQIQNANKMYFIENRYRITFDEITSILNDNKIPYFYDDGNVYIYYGRKDEAYEFYSVADDNLTKYFLSSDNSWNYGGFSVFRQIDINNKDDLNNMKTGYCYLHSYDDLSSFDFPEKADKTKGSLLVCYGDDYTGIGMRQVLYNESNLFTRDGFVEMGNNVWNDWTELTSSSISLPTMYVHVTSEEKDGETVYKSDKTYEEITTALTENKIVVVNYENQSLFYSDASIVENTHIFYNNDLIVMIASDAIIATELPISFVVPATYTETNPSNPTFTVDDSDINKMHVYAKLYGTLPDVLLTVVDYNREHKVLLSSASQYDFTSMSVTYYWDCFTTRNERNSTTDNTRIYCRLSYNGIMNTFCEYFEQTILPIDAPHISDISDYNQVVVSDEGYLYAPKTNTVSYYPTMDKVSNQNTAGGMIAVVYAKGSSNIDVAYPAVVFSTETQSYGIFDGWIVDANGNHYSCAIRSSGVTLRSKTVSGMPQPTENDANKVLCGDMTWKDAQNITDEHINTLIDKKLGVIENGTY